MNDPIAHRPTRRQGYFVEGNIGLAMRRLSIIELKTGHQPISNENDRLVDRS